MESLAKYNKRKRSTYNDHGISPEGFFNCLLITVSSRMFQANESREICSQEGG